jgi:hypothetical protein
MNTRIIAISLTAATLAVGLTACTSAADEASRNLSTAAENFEVERRITFINGITGEFFLSIEGFCSVDAQDELPGDALSVTCKVAPNEYTKDYLGLSDNVTYMSEQLNGIDVSLYHRRILIRPETIMPDLELNAGVQ